MFTCCMYCKADLAKTKCKPNCPKVNLEEARKRVEKSKRDIRNIKRRKTLTSTIKESYIHGLRQDITILSRAIWFMENR